MKIRTARTKGLPADFTSNGTVRDQVGGGATWTGENLIATNNGLREGLGANAIVVNTCDGQTHVLPDP